MRDKRGTPWFERSPSHPERFLPEAAWLLFGASRTWWSDAFSAVASAASPVTNARQDSSYPLRLPFGTSLKPSGVMVSV